MTLPLSLASTQPEDMKNASEEVVKLFSKSGSSASSPETVSDDVTSLRQELTALKQSYSKANEVGGVVGVFFGYYSAVQELVGLKGKVSELSRRLEDATRAYQQERRVSFFVD